MKNVVTRFRAYQLGSHGSSFSYFAGGHFTLLEGRLTDLSRRSLLTEMDRCGVTSADALHITSWDDDHCKLNELRELLDLTLPTTIECPGYDPYTDSGVGCLELIAEYRDDLRHSNRRPEIRHITPRYITSLTHAERLSFNNILYNPLHIDPKCANDNSTVQQFRKGSFNVLSLGDVQSQLISARLRRCRLLQLETDVMILAHHGADNGFTNKNFIAALEPNLAICSSDYDNQYDHPRDEIRELLHERGIRLMTTKTGDVVLRSIDDHTGQYEAINLKANSTEISSSCKFISKKTKLLSYNQDTIRQIYAPRPSYPR
jgi:competence protein ComEC